MEELYKHIKKINKLKKIKKSLAVCKLFEECGELSQQINIDLGIKNGNKFEVRSGVLEECADSIQNLFSIANLYNITFEELTKELIKKNNKWLKSK